MSAVTPNFWPADAEDTQATKYYVKAGAAASIKAGDIVLQNTGGDDNYVVAAGTQVVNTDDAKIVGVAATTSDDTASADGTVMIYDDVDTKYIGRPLSTGDVAATIRLTGVTVDSAATGVQTVKLADTTKPVVTVLDYDDNNNITFRFIRSAFFGA